jgi:hypothetical protein
LPTFYFEQKNIYTNQWGDGMWMVLHEKRVPLNTVSSAP